MENTTAPAPKFHDYTRDTLRNKITTEKKYFGINFLTKQIEIITDVFNSKISKEERKVTYKFLGFITFYYQITNKFS